MTCGDVLENCAAFRGMPPKDVEQLRWGMRRAIVCHVHVIGLEWSLGCRLWTLRTVFKANVGCQCRWVGTKRHEPFRRLVCPFGTFGALSQVVLAGELLNKLCGLIVWKYVSLVGDGRFVCCSWNSHF